MTDARCTELDLNPSVSGSYTSLGHGVYKKSYSCQLESLIFIISSSKYLLFLFTPKKGVHPSTIKSCPGPDASDQGVKSHLLVSPELNKSEKRD